jgi:hypothetical protein
MVAVSVSRIDAVIYQSSLPLRKRKVRNADEPLA